MFLHVLFHDVLVVLFRLFPSLALQIELVQVVSRVTAESNFGVSWSLGVQVRFSLPGSLSFGYFRSTLFRLGIQSSTIDLRRVETPAVDLRVVFSLEPLKQISLNYFTR